MTGPRMETFDRRGRRRWAKVDGGPSMSGKRRRRRPRVSLRVVLVLLLLIALACAAGWWWYTRPAAVSVTASPPDAIITFEGVDYHGDMLVDGLAPGTYRVSVERLGFEPLETTVELTRLKTTEASYVLRSLPIEFSVASNPSGASYRISSADGTVLVGETPYVGTLPAGDTEVTLEMAGYNEYRRELMLDTPTDLALWMDPSGQIVRCLNVFDCGPGPKGASFSPDGSEVWVTLLTGPPSIQVFDPESGELLDELVLDEHGAVEVLFTADGSRVYVSQMETARVYEIDASTREVLRTFDTESAWTKMLTFAPGEERLFASNWSGDDVSEFDLTTGEMVRRHGTVDTPRGLYVTADGNDLYVSGFGTGVIQRVDLDDDTRETVYSGGTAIRHFAADATRGILYASDMGTDEIVALDLTTGEASRFAATDEKPNTIALSPDGKVLFVSCRGENNASSYYLPGPEWGSILLFDTTTGEPLDAIVGGNQPTALDVSRDGTRLIFSDLLDDRLRYYEIPSHDVLAAGGGGLYEAHFDMIAK